jgi:hypothetical protein
VLAHTPGTSDQLEKKEFTRSIQPRHRMRTINFATEAVRAATQPNSTHDDTVESLGLLRNRDTGGVRDDAVDTSIQPLRGDASAVRCP